MPGPENFMPEENGGEFAVDPTEQIRQLEEQLAAAQLTIARQSEVISAISSPGPTEETNPNEAPEAVAAGVEEDVLVDALTGLPNKNALMKDLAEAAAKAPEEVGVIFVDLDKFKELNTRLGHDAVDDLLRELAKTLRGAAAFYRLGGDEFAIALLPTTKNLPPPEGERRSYRLTQSGVDSVIARAQRAISENQTLNQAGVAASMAGCKLRTDANSGAPLESPRELLERADKKTEITKQIRYGKEYLTADPDTQRAVESVLSAGEESARTIATMVEAVLAVLSTDNPSAYGDLPSQLTAKLSQEQEQQPRNEQPAKPARTETRGTLSHRQPLRGVNRYGRLHNTTGRPSHARTHSIV